MRCSLQILAFSVLWCALLPDLAAAREYVLTIGGGYSPSGNQVSLEKNVQLFRRVLSGSGLNFARYDTLFSDGNGSQKDVQVIDPEAVPKANRLMAEFFGSSRELGLAYRNHQLPDVRAAITPDNVRRWFRQVGPSLAAGDRLMIYVTAHGNESRDRDRKYNTSIAMWNNTSMQMDAFAKLLDGLDEGVDVVMVMVQCYTGGFSHLMFREGDPKKGLSPQRRVGFFATVHDRPAAGCTPEVDETNYVEYSTYFWSAISGVDRAGNPIPEPDYDGDGRVSFEEAHAYTILSADTIDLPVKTSGEYLNIESKFGDAKDGLLDNDEPYSLVLKFASPVQWKVLEDLSKKLNLNGENRLVDAYEKTKTERRRRRTPTKESVSVRRRIAADVKKKWPELANLMNPKAISLVTTEQDEFVRVIETHRDYNRYRQLVAKEKAAPDAQQTRVQYERFLRVADNVVLAENLRRMNRPAKLAEYEAIVAGERGFFVSELATSSIAAE